MNVAAPAATTVFLCSDIGEYARAACEILEAGMPLRGVPLLDGDRPAEQLDALFPNRLLRSARPAGGAVAGGVEALARRLLAARPCDGDPERILVTEAGAPDSIPAIFYALATGRSVVLAKDMSASEKALDGAGSAILAGRAELFGKTYLKRLLDWSQIAPAPRQLGIVTGRDLAQSCDLFAKSLLARDGPGETGRDPAYELIGAHGNEIHLDFRDRVLCGRVPRPRAIGDFDCGIGCPHQERLEADRIRARTILLVSCDGFTPAGGLAPSDFSLLFRLLDGQACAILAPYKHVQANENVLVMVEAMARSGYSLGEIAYLVNARANVGALPDYGYLVLGDPEFQALPAANPPAEVPKITDTSHGILVRTRCGPDRHALSLRVPAPQSDEPLAVLPVSARLRAANIFFALGMSPAAEMMEVTLFSDERLPEGPVEFAIVKARRPAMAKISEAVERLHKLRLFRSIFGESEAANSHEKAIRDLLGMAVTFPRPIEIAMGQNMLLNFDRLVRSEFTQLQGALCDAILAALARRRIWISQEYGGLFARVQRAGPGHDGECPHCANHVTAWAYEDWLNGFASRHVLICSRCGIIADGPSESPVAVEFETIGCFQRSEERMTIRIRNLGDLPLGVSLAVQLNDWKAAGVQGTDCRVDFAIGPGETRTHCATLHFPEAFQDDILSVQLFLVSDMLDLFFVSQKVRSVVRGIRTTPYSPAPLSVEGSQTPHP